MNSLKKLRKNLRRTIVHLKSSNNEFYIYMPLSDNKNGYVMEYYYQSYHQLFYYKYKENGDGSLTKYGYLIVDAHNNNNNNNSRYTNNNATNNNNNSYKSQRNNLINSNNSSNNSINKSLWSNKDKECIFYQTVVDKIQIDLEKKWMKLLRNKGRLEIKVDGNDNNGFIGEYEEWNELMQHNNDFLMSDSIQRRRLNKVLGELLDSDYNSNNNENNGKNDNNVTSFLGNIGERNERLRSELEKELEKIDNCNNINFDDLDKRILENHRIKTDLTSSTNFTQPSSLPTTSPSMISSTLLPKPLASSLPSAPLTLSTFVDDGDLTLCTPLMSPSYNHLVENSSRVKKSFTTNNRTKENQSQEKKPRKHTQLVHTKFSKKEPEVLVYDPEDILIFKGCKCDYCILEYNE